MAFPDGYVYHNGFWYASDGSGPWFIDSDGTALAMAVPVTDITVANLALVAASSTNIGKMYFVTDLRGGCLVKSNGSTWAEVTPAINDGSGLSAPASTWAARGSGSTVGQVKRITDLGNNPLAEAVWDGTRWRPRGGRQLIYQLTAAITNTQINPHCVLPNVTIPGNLMGIVDGFLVEASWDYGAGPPSNVSESLTLGGTTLRNNTNNGTNRRRWFTQRVLNAFATGSQYSLEKNSGGEYGAPGTASSVYNTLSKNTTGDLVLAGDMTCTSVSATATMYMYNVWWVRG